MLWGALIVARNSIETDTLDNFGLFFVGHTDRDTQTHRRTDTLLIFSTLDKPRRGFATDRLVHDFGVG